MANFEEFLYFIYYILKILMGGILKERNHSRNNREFTYVEEI